MLPPVTPARRAFAGPLRNARLFLALGLAIMFGSHLTALSVLAQTQTDDLIVIKNAAGQMTARFTYEGYWGLAGQFHPNFGTISLTAGHKYWSLKSATGAVLFAIDCESGEAWAAGPVLQGETDIDPTGSVFSQDDYNGATAMSVFSDGTVKLIGGGFAGYIVYPAATPTTTYEVRFYQPSWIPTSSSPSPVWLGCALSPSNAINWGNTITVTIFDPYFIHSDGSYYHYRTFSVSSVSSLMTKWDGYLYLDGDETKPVRVVSSEVFMRVQIGDVTFNAPCFSITSPNDYSGEDPQCLAKNGDGVLNDIAGNCFEFSSGASVFSGSLDMANFSNEIPVPAGKIETPHIAIVGGTFAIQDNDFGTAFGNLEGRVRVSISPVFDSHGAGQTTRIVWATPWPGDPTKAVATIVPGVPWGRWGASGHLRGLPQVPPYTYGRIPEGIHEELCKNQTITFE